MDIKDIIEQQAALALNSGATVMIDRHYGTVSIDWDEGQCFLQYDDADRFISRTDALWRENPETGRGECDLCEAWQYIESLSN